MADTTTTYWIEANEGGVAKMVPHDGKKNCKFLVRETALEFLNQLRENNPSTQFRLTTSRTVNTHGKWEKN